MAIFSISDVRTFKKCRQRADFTISARMSLRPLRPAIYYTVGEIAHEALEKYYNGAEDAWLFYREAVEKELEAWRDFPKFDDIYEEATRFTYVLQAYMKRWAPHNDHFKMLNTEVRDIIELSNGHYFTFKYDGLVKKKDGTIWLKEFKTTASLPSDLGWLQIDDQVAAYQWAVEKVTDMKISGSIYTWLRKKNPTRPRELASGGISMAKNIVTTAEAFYEGVTDLGYNPRGYRDFLKYIVDKEGSDFFLRTEVVTNPHQRQRMEAQIEQITEEMGDPEANMYPCPSQMNCSRCDFFAPCAAKQLGLNYKALLKNDYEKGGYY